MEIYITDVKVAIIIVTNVSISEKGSGTLTIKLPKDYSILISYEGNLKDRTIKIEKSQELIMEWNGGDIIPEEIENLLHKLSQNF